MQGFKAGTMMGMPAFVILKGYSDGPRAKQNTNKQTKSTKPKLGKVLGKEANYESFMGLESSQLRLRFKNIYYT